MSLSGPDIKGALSALPILVLLLVGSHIALYYIHRGAYDAFVQGINMAGSYLTGILLLSLMLAVFSVVIAMAIHGILHLLGFRR